MFPRTNSCGSIRLLDTALGGFIRFRHMEDTAAATVATVAVAVEDTICVSWVSYGVARKGMDKSTKGWGARSDRPIRSNGTTTSNGW